MKFSLGAVENIPWHLCTGRARVDKAKRPSVAANRIIADGLRQVQNRLKFSEIILIWVNY